MKQLNPISLNLCRPTLRGIGDTPPEYSWFPVWMLCRHLKFRWDERPDFLIFGDAGSGEHLLYPPRTIRIFVTGENVQANWDEADYAFTHERTWSARHWRIPLWRHWYDTASAPPVRDFEMVRARVDRFCNFIYSNERAMERVEFFHRLSRVMPVDSGGRLLNNIGGPVEEKRAYLKRCKFTIAFENQSHPGYATEKILEPLLCGSIPIYWGDPMIHEDFNPDCLINVHDYPNYDAVIDRVLQIDRDDELWARYLAAPIFRDNRLPERLTDEAILARFTEIVRAPKSYVPRRRKAWQGLTQRARTLVTPLLSGPTVRRIESGVRVCVRRAIARCCHDRSAAMEERAVSRQKK